MKEKNLHFSLQSVLGAPITNVTRKKRLLAGSIDFGCMVVSAIIGMLLVYGVTLSVGAHEGSYSWLWWVTAAAMCLYALVFSFHGESIGFRFTGLHLINKNNQSANLKHRLAKTLLHIALYSPILFSIVQTHGSYPLAINVVFLILFFDYIVGVITKNFLHERIVRCYVAGK